MSDFLFVDAEILKNWQTLFGIILGALISLMGFYLQSVWKSILERKENKRRLEISLTIALNDIFDTRLTINIFKQRVTEIIQEIDRVLADDTKYLLDETNMPVMEIYFDQNLVFAKTKSYYIHNNILGAASAIKSINSNFVDMKQNFKSLSEKNIFLVNLQVSKHEQKVTYKGNLQNILNIMDEMLKHLSIGALTLTRIKFYNESLRNRWGFLTSWRYEGCSFKYFKNKAAMNEYSVDMASLERIDNLIDDKVKELIEKHEKAFTNRHAQQG
jgi:hypothetical protein